MRLEAPDELFYLKGQGSAELEFSESMFPYTQSGLQRTRVVVRAIGEAASNLVLRLTSAGLGDTLTVSLDANGIADSDTAGANPLRRLVDNPVEDTWEIGVSVEDNPDLVVDDVLDLTGLDDLTAFIEYDFEYR